MGEHSGISWTDATFNPWWGCTKVSPACKNCYADTWARRTGASLWGDAAPRRFFGDKHWAEPLRWNAAAEKAGVRRRVFCASMADVFEARGELDPHRERLWRLIEATPHLDWLLLTKRPENIAKMLGTATPNVWLGTTVENEEMAEKRVPALLSNPATVHFLSCEPLLGPLDLRPWLVSDTHVSWVLVGGESGGGARPMQPAWALDIRDQCMAAEVPFHFKQWGEHDERLVRIGKKRAGRLLDGLEWDEFPEVQP